MPFFRRSIVCFSVLFVTVVVAGAAWLFGPTIANRNDGFRLHRIYSQLQHDPRWETTQPSEQILKAAHQRYRYLGKGAQVYAFASEDGRYVLKFFKHQHLSMAPWIKALPLAGPLARLRDESAARKQRKLEENFGSYTLASRRLQQQTGIVAAHLNKTEQQWGSVEIEDISGRTYRVALDLVEFVLQERADRIDRYIEAHPEEQDVIVANSAATVHSRLACGVIDTDPAFLPNYGVTADGRVIQIDVGRFQEVAGLAEDASAQQERFAIESAQLFEYYPL